MSPLFCEKGGTLFKGEHYLRKYGNLVDKSADYNKQANLYQARALYELTEDLKINLDRS